MPKPIKKVTIGDIARELNVNVSTVSRALRGHDTISPKTKAAIEKVAKKLSYHPNTIASSLRLGKSRLLGVLIPSAEINFFGSVVHGVEKIANENNYNVIIYQTNEMEDIERKGVTTFLRSRVDGILASISKESKSLDHFADVKRRGVPLVLFDRVDDKLAVPSVVVNDFKGAYNATQHLIEQGCKKIVHIAGPQHVEIFKQRQDGYKKAMNENGFSDKDQMITHGLISVDSGYDCTKELLASNKKFDGIFAVEDFTALGAIKALKEAGKKMPEDVAVIGFANEAFGEYITPSLSTVDQQTIRMGENAAKLFFDLSQDGNFYKSESKKIVLEPRLMFRDSSLKKKHTKSC
jgi:LacI family transcriptional regulator